MSVIKLTENMIKRSQSFSDLERFVIRKSFERIESERKRKLENERILEKCKELEQMNETEF